VYTDPDLERGGVASDLLRVVVSAEGSVLDSEGEAHCHHADATSDDTDEGRNPTRVSGINRLVQAHCENDGRPHGQDDQRSTSFAARDRGLVNHPSGADSGGGVASVPRSSTQQ